MTIAVDLGRKATNKRDNTSSLIIIVFGRTNYGITHSPIRESPPQSENRIMARVYVRSITRSTMYQKSSILLAGTSVRKISSVACGFSSIKIDSNDYPKSLISRIN